MKCNDKSLAYSGVSVLSANYNNSKFLTDYFESLLNSSVLPDEIIIVDDASNDDSIEVIKKYATEYSLIKLVKLEKNVGFANALNIGLKHVSGNYVIRLDPDDYVNRDRIKLQLERMIDDPEIEIVGSNVDFFDSSTGRIIRSSQLPIKHKDILQEYNNVSHGLAHGGVCVKAETFKKYHYRQEYVPAEEYDIFSRMLSDGVNATNIEAALPKVRIHKGSVSNNIKLTTVMKMYILAENIWGVKVRLYNVWHSYITRKYYRKYMFDNTIMRMIYILLVIIINPYKSIRKIISRKS